MNQCKSNKIQEHHAKINENLRKSANLENQEKYQKQKELICQNPRLIQAWGLRE